jgi:hypothetical protein
MPGAAGEMRPSRSVPARGPRTNLASVAIIAKLSGPVSTGSTPAASEQPGCWKPANSPCPPAVLPLGSISAARRPLPTLRGPPCLFSGKRARRRRFPSICNSAQSIPQALSSDKVTV